MYLSQWRLNRPKTSAGGYFNPYDLHKILWKTFPGRPEAKRDFLFRVDKIGKDFSVLLLSAVEPAAAEDLIQLRETAQLDLKLETGAVYRFALRANPVKGSRRNATGSLWLATRNCPPGSNGSLPARPKYWNLRPANVWT